MNQILSNQIRQGIRKLHIARLALALAVSVGFVSLAVADGSDGSSGGLVGTWQAVETCCNGTNVQYTYSITFGAGTDANSGFVVQSDSGLAGVCMNTQGVWQSVNDSGSRGASHTFIATYQGYCSNTTVSPPDRFIIHFNASITLDESGTTFHGTESLTFIQANGTIGGPYTGTLQGTRMQAQAP